MPTSLSWKIEGVAFDPFDVEMILIVGGGRLASRIRSLLVQLPEVSRDSATVQIADHLHLNVCEPRQVVEYLSRSRQRGARVVINCAAFTDVNQMESWPLKGGAVNSIAPGFLAVACDSLDMKLLQVSTDYVFGGGRPGPYSIVDTPFPVQQYGLSKLRGEWASRMSENTVVARIGWLFGPEYPECAPMLASKGQKITVEHPNGTSSEGMYKAVTIWDDITGTPTHVEAAARVILRLAWQMYDGMVDLPPLVHVASGEGPLSWYDFLVGRYPEIRRGTSAVNNVTARRPRNGGLVASPEGITMKYGEMMDLFQAELRGEKPISLSGGTR